MKKVSNKLRVSAFLLIFAGKALIFKADRNFLRFVALKFYMATGQKLPTYPLPLGNINTYFSLWEKCWLREEVMGSFPETYNDPLYA